MNSAAYARLIVPAATPEIFTGVGDGEGVTPHYMVGGWWTHARVAGVLTMGGHIWLPSVRFGARGKRITNFYSSLVKR